LLDRPSFEDSNLWGKMAVALKMIGNCQCVHALSQMDLASSVPESAPSSLGEGTVIIISLRYDIVHHIITSLLLRVETEYHLRDGRDFIRTEAAPFVRGRLGEN
jgi:hypothetical protein